MPANPLYERVFYAWANEQAALLRNGKSSEVGIAHIAEMIEAWAGPGSANSSAASRSCCYIFSNGSISLC